MYGVLLLGALLEKHVGSHGKNQSLTWETDNSISGDAANDWWLSAAGTLWSYDGTIALIALISALITGLLVMAGISMGQITPRTTYLQQPMPSSWF